jgi:hypothetical protein
LAVEWEATVDKWKNITKFSKTVPVKRQIITPPVKQVPALLKPKTLGWHTSAGIKAPNFYTGTFIKGVATMHKSNMVPITNAEDAVAISHMRR